MMKKPKSGNAAQVNERDETAREFLIASDREFAAGDLIQGSEKLRAAAAAHAVGERRDFGSQAALHIQSAG